MLIDVWLRIDARPFKQALLNIVKRWSYMFKQHLIDHVTNSLQDLEEFIKVRYAHAANPILLWPAANDSCTKGGKGRRKRHG